MITSKGSSDNVRTKGANIRQLNLTPYAGTVLKVFQRELAGVGSKENSRPILLLGLVARV